MNQSFREENGHLINDVSFDQNEIAQATEKAVNKLCENVTVKGFRKGKAPVSEARRHLRSQDVYEETVQQLLKVLDKNHESDYTFNSYLNGNKLASNLRPNVNLSKFSNTEAVFVITYILRPIVSKLGEYKNLSSSITEEEVTDESIERRLGELANDNAELVSTEEPAKEGDTVNIDFVGYMDGKEFDGGSSKAFDLVLGSHKFVPGFEEQCIGHKAGDSFDLRLTMPENYPEPLTGKDVVYKVVINEVKVPEIPAVDDDFATTLSGELASENLEELRGKVRDQLVNTNHKNYLNNLVNSLFNQIRDSSEFVIADEYIDVYVDQRQHNDEHQVEEQGLSLEEYLKLVNMSYEDYRNNLKNGVTAELKASLIYDALASAEQIPAPVQSDIEARLGTPLNQFVSVYSKYLKSQNISDDEVNNYINNYINQIFISIFNERIQSRILEINGFKAPEPQNEPASEGEAEESEVVVEEEAPSSEEEAE